MTIAVINDTQPAASQETAQIPNAPAPFLPPVNFTPTEWFSRGYLDAEYTFYAIYTTYDTDLGLQAAPCTASRITNPGTSQPNLTNPNATTIADENIIVRVRRPITFKIVNWTAQRLHVKPLLPHWNTGTTNEKLLRKTMSYLNPLQSLNHKTWEVSGQYVYAFKREPFITINGVEYFVIPAGKSTAENSKIPVTMHAYTQADFSFVPLDAAWIPVTKPLETPLPVGYTGRVGLPDGARFGAPLERVGPA